MILQFLSLFIRQKSSLLREIGRPNIDTLDPCDSADVTIRLDAILFLGRPPLLRQKHSQSRPTRVSYNTHSNSTILCQPFSTSSHSAHPSKHSKQHKRDDPQTQCRMARFTPQAYSNFQMSCSLSSRAIWLRKTHYACARLAAAFSISSTGQLTSHSHHCSSFQLSCNVVSRTTSTQRSDADSTRLAVTFAIFLSSTLPLAL